MPRVILKKKNNRLAVFPKKIKNWERLLAVKNMRETERAKRQLIMREQLLAEENEFESKNPNDRPEIKPVSVIKVTTTIF